MLNNHYYKKYYEEHFSILDELESPIVWQIYIGLVNYVDTGVVSDLLAMHNTPIDFNGMIPELFACSEATFVMVKLKYSGLIVRSWTKKEFLDVIQLAYRNKRVIDSEVMEKFNPLRSLTWLINQADR